MNILLKNKDNYINNSKIWEKWSKEEIVSFQLFTEELCMPFGIFHEATEHCLGRSVWTHEFAYADKLQKEYLGEKPAPTMDEIINLIPEEKRIIINIEDTNETNH